MIRYSIIVPVFNEQDTLAELYRRMAPVLAMLDGEVEVFIVDDGSTDATYARALALHAEDPRFNVVRLSRNFGHQVAITAGLDRASGQAVMLMDGDLQHPPELIPKFVEKWKEGYEVVYGVMDQRLGESVFKRKSAALFYRVLRRVAGVDIPAAASDFRLVDAQALAAFLSMRETNRFVRGMFAWIGFRQCGIPYSVPPRFAGASKYTKSRMIQLALDGVVSFSGVPLLRAIKLGFVASIAAFILGVSAVITKLAGGSTVPGWATITVVASFLGGIQLIVLGVIGEYLARVFDEVKGRPLYVVQDVNGLRPDGAEVAGAMSQNVVSRRR